MAVFGLSAGLMRYLSNDPGTQFKLGTVRRKSTTLYSLRGDDNVLSLHSRGRKMLWHIEALCWSSAAERC